MNAADHTLSETEARTFHTDHGKITTADRFAVAALTVGRTASAGSVAGSLHSYLMTPDGGWGETQQAWRALVDAVDAASRNATWHDAERAAVNLVDAAIASGWERHPSRR